MNEIILHLMNEVSTLTPPINPLNLKQIFSSTPLPEGKAPVEVESQLILLLLIKKYVDEYSSLAEEQEEYKRKKHKLDEVMKKGEELQRKISDLAKKIEHAKNELNPLYKEIEPKANEVLSKQNPLAPPYKFPEYGEVQKSIVVGHYSYLFKTTKEIETTRAKLKLVLLKNKWNALMTDLSQLGIQPPVEEDTVDSLQKFIAAVELEIKKLTRACEKWDGLQKRFAKQLSATDINKKETELEKQIELLLKDLGRIEAVVTDHSLAPDLKAELTRKFQESEEPRGLIQEYQNQIDGLLSNFNPSAWLSWYSDSNYSDNQQKLKNSVSFLQLLAQQKELKIKHHELVKQQELLIKAIPETPSNEEDIYIYKKLVPDAIDLINEIPIESIPNFVLPSGLSYDSSPADFYLVLLILMPKVSEKKEQFSQALEKLQEMPALGKQIQQLRSGYDLPITMDVQLPSLQEAEENKDSLNEEDPLKEELKSQIKLCQSYLETAKQIDLLMKDHGQTTNEAKALIEQLRLISNQPLKSEDINSIKENLSTLTNQIQSLVSELNQLPLPNLSGEKIDPPLEKQEIAVDKAIPLTVELMHPAQVVQKDSEYTVEIRQVDNGQATPVVLESTHPTQMIQKDSESTVEKRQVDNGQEIPVTLELTHPTQMIQKDSESTVEKRQVDNGQEIPVTLELTHPTQMIQKDSESTVEKRQLGNGQEIPVALESTHTTQVIQKDSATIVEKRQVDNGQIAPIVLESTHPTQVIQQDSESGAEQQVLNGQETPVVVKSTPSTHVVKKQEIKKGQEKQVDLKSAPSEPLRPSTPEVPVISRKPNGLSLFNGHDELSEDNILAFFDEAGNQISIPSEEDSETLTIDRGKVISSGVDKAFREKLVSTGHELDKLSNPQHQESAPSISPLPPSSILLKQKLDSFHVQNMEYIKQHSEEIQLWYKGLYDTAQSSCLNEALGLKALHLFKDILFEFKNQNDLSVLLAYKRMCPIPLQDIQNILRLKPALPILDESIDEEQQLKSWPEELQKFHQQYVKLKKEHPLEAELFIQATHSLISIKHLMELPDAKTSSREAIPLITQDPRYEPLKRHRGFIKAWEYIEDFFRMLIGKLTGQDEYEYSKKPCFFKTRTHQLLEEADTMLHSMAPTSS
ncbi:TPA: interaptin [Legionella pneumophila]|uniref:interaptin n=1 Tax=Legionella sp. PATHC039 TaxID=2992042 RepID=UPI001A1B693F|nr:interaptin [Legionella sp. PATHC039]HAT7073580.1 interaptin [Legionella pneumophila]HAT8859310.1 interaptin [Legionella pneumophila subsp. pneumophila]MCW8396605.1 interaptin [Legionella sp. PATHC039]HAT9650924.1 interaptin [Legionella pneumophila subsp. pneumophila]HAT9920316.1 interaptin [Legionella pneumophila subsp. pneumophila]